MRPSEDPRWSARTRPHRRSRRDRRPASRRPVALPRRTPPCRSPPSAADPDRRSRCRNPPAVRCRGVVQRGVGRLGDGDLVDAVARRRRHDRQQLGEARADAGAEQRRAAALTRLDQPGPAVAEVVAGDERRARHHVHPGLQDAHQFVDVDPHRVVHHRIGFQREQCVDVVGGVDAERLDPGQFADVAAHLLRRPGVAADQFQIRIGRDRRDRTLTDIAGRPLDDPIGSVWHSLRLGGTHRIFPDRRKFGHRCVR